MSEIVNLIADARSAAFEHRFADAAAQAATALDRLPSCLLALRIQAWAQLELDDDMALETFQSCAELDPEDALAHVGQAIWYQQRSQIQAAVEQWTRAWELDPHNQSIRRALVKLTGELPESPFADAIALIRAGRADDAVDVLRRLRKQRKDVAVGLSLVNALWTIGARHEAFELATSVLANHPRSVKAALYVAALEEHAGRTLRCREAIARVEHVDPGLAVFSDIVRQVGLQPALDLHRASRVQLAAAR